MLALLFGKCFKCNALCAYEAAESHVYSAGDGYVALEFPAGSNSANPHLMASAAEDNTDYVIITPPLTFLRHFHEVAAYMISHVHCSQCGQSDHVIVS